MVRLRRHMVPDGEWAVTGYDGDPLPGRWATEAEAVEHGFLGVYLLSGIDVAKVGPEVSHPSAIIR